MAEFLGKYELRAVLGKGAMGTVYDGFDPLIARQVAIKTVRLPAPDDHEALEELARFRREAQAAGRLSHPNIVGVFDYGETPDLAYIVMEFVDGTTLKHHTDKHERFELPEIVRLMTELMAGLQYSHDRGVVHRDIKPANIMLTKRGEVKIADFGIARIESSSMTQAGTMLGTPSYMSPEQFMGTTVDARTDLYSSGVLLYQLLTGEKPFEGGLTAIMHKVLNTEPPPPSALAVTVSPAFDEVVKKAMAKRPEDRFASAAEFATAVKAAFEAKTLSPAAASFGLGATDFGDGDATLVAPSARPAPPPRPPPVTTRQAAPPAKKGPNLALFGAAAAVLVLLLAAGGFLLLGHKSPPPTVQTPVQPHVQPPMQPPVQTPVVSSPPAKPIAPPAPVTPPPAPAMTTDAMQAAISKTLGNLPCSLLSAALTNDNGHADVTLTGLIGDSGSAALSQAETALPQNFTLTTQVQTISGPYCNALDAIRPYNALFGGGDLKLALTGGDRILHNNQIIGIDETLPPGASNVQTDYFQGDGTVFHPGNPTVSPGQSTLSQQIGRVSAPYGMDLLISVASTAPIFPAARPQVENDSDYLPALTQALQTASANGAEIYVAAVPVATAP